MKPKVYVVIANWNGLQDTLECMASLRDVTYENFKVVVVDNGSRENEAEKIKERYPEAVTSREEQNQGYVGGHNKGSTIALRDPECAYILHLCNDTVVTRDFLDILVLYMEEQPEAAAVGPKVLYYNSDKIWFNGAVIYWWLGMSRHLERLVSDADSKIRIPTRVDYVTGACMLQRRKVVEEIGMFDPVYFSYYEDVDWCFRAKKAGYESAVVPGARISHKVSSAQGVRGTQKISEIQAGYYGRNALIFGRRHFPGVRKIVFLFMQYTVRLGFNMFLCKNNKARMHYIKGLLGT